MSSVPHSNEPSHRRAFRLALGVTIAFTFTQLFPWPLAHLAPVVVVLLLQDAAPLSYRAGGKLLVIALVFFVGGGMLTHLLSPWPPLLILAVAALLYRMYMYMLTSGAHILASIASLVGFVVLPVLVNLYPALGLVAAYGFFLDFLAAIFISWLTWLIVPSVAPPPAEHHEEVSAEVAREMAITLMIIILPLMAVFLFFGWSSVLILAYAVIFSAEYGSEGVRKEGLNYIVANGVYAGVAMMICYELFVMIPSVWFMVPVVFIVLLFFSKRVFKHGPTEAFWGSGIFGFLILLGAVLLKEGADTPYAVIDRVWQMCAATAYVAFAFSVVEMMRAPFRGKQGAEMQVDSSCT